MSVTTPQQVRCRHCEAENDHEHAYCGVCGHVLDALLAPGVLTLGGRARAYPRLLVISGVLCVVSAVVAMAASVVSAQAGPWDFGFGIADAAFNTNLSGDGGGSTLFVTVTLMLSFIVAVLS